MNPDLRRIEATLYQLDQPATFFRSRSVEVNRTSRTYSFELDRTSVSTQPAAASHRAETGVHSFPTERNNPKASPLLPKLKPASFSSHRNVANPNLAMEVLQDIEARVLGWQTELVQVLQQIQGLYLEGPIVDGWLESQSPQNMPSTAPGTSKLHHIEIDQLISYVDEISDSQPSVSYQVYPAYGSVEPESEKESGKGYWLYGLNEDGQVWSRPCPSEQIPSVSLAIARYQRLRQLLARKQQLETRLNQLAETLLVLQDHLESQIY